jgi:hypothetical protein
MQSNFLVIVFSGVSISLLGVCILILPDFVKSFINNNIECFLTIPPISVASYILVFKYHEKLQGKSPPIGDLLYTILQGTFAASFFFFLIAIISSMLFLDFI